MNLSAWREEFSFLKDDFVSEQFYDQTEALFQRACKLHLGAGTEDLDAWLPGNEVTFTDVLDIQVDEAADHVFGYLGLDEASLEATKINNSGVLEQVCFLIACDAEIVLNSSEPSNHLSRQEILSALAVCAESFLRKLYDEISQAPAEDDSNPNHPEEATMPTKCAVA